MSEVTRVNDPNIAPLDGVALGAKCIVTRFSTAKNKVVSIKSQEMADCSIKASMELGIMSISVPGRAQMVSIRIDEAMAVLKEAADAANDVAAGRKEGKADG
jgi:hypothetical protein